MSKPKFFFFCSTSTSRPRPLLSHCLSLPLSPNQIESDCTRIVTRVPFSSCFFFFSGLYCKKKKRIESKFVDPIKKEAKNAFFFQKLFIFEAKFCGARAQRRRGQWEARTSPGQDRELVLYFKPGGGGGGEGEGEIRVYQF